jgi:hypothetical protein
MAFVDHQINAGLCGKTVSGLGLTKTAAMTLEVASGSVTDHQTGTTYTLASAQNHVFTSDSTDPKNAFMAVIDNGSTTDLWVDEYVDDGTLMRDDPPSGYSVVLEIGWFSFAANETDLDNASINRRVYV